MRRCSFKTPTSCGYQCDRFCPCVSMYPALCTVFLTLLVAAAIVAIVAAYSFISLRISIFSFQWSPLMLTAIHVSLLAVVAVVLLTALSVLLWCVCRTPRSATACKAFYVLALLLALTVLAVCIAAAVLVIYGASTKSSFFSRGLKHVWLKELKNSTSTLACRVQFQLSCHGFEEADCQSGSATRNYAQCATNCLPQHLEGRPKFNIERYPGCRNRISKVFIQWNAILLAGSAVAFILVLVSLFFTCTSVSFEMGT